MDQEIPATETGSLPRPAPRFLEPAVVATLALVYGVVCVEMVSVGYLLPFIAPDLHLSNTQVGILVAGYWLSFAGSSFAMSIVADLKGRQTQILCIALAIFAVLSPLSGFARSFLGLFGARVVMGLAEGPVLPLAQTIALFVSSEKRRGVNMGIVLNVGTGLLSGILAPICLVNLAAHHGWRAGFFVVALPGVICAVGITLLLRGRLESPTPPSDGARSHAESMGYSVREVLRSRNVLLCGAITCLTVGFGVIGLTYLPLYVVGVRHFLPSQTSFLMSVLGMSGLLLSVPMMGIADRFGRKPVAVVGTLIGVCFSLTALYFTGPMMVFLAGMSLGWALTGTVPLFMSTIPSESVSSRSISTAIGLMVAVSNLLGGAALPMIAGWGADRWGLRVALLIEAGCAVGAGLLSLALRETAPARVRPVPR